MSKEVITREVPDEPLSEQGEQQAAKRTIIWATDAEVESFVQEARETDPYKLACRGRPGGRHIYEAPKELIFTGITRDGLWVREIPCHGCHAPGEKVKVVRIELWEVVHYRGKITRCKIVGSYPGYKDPSYLNHGGGRMKPRQVQSAEVTLVLRGQQYRDVRKQVILRALPQLLSDASATLEVEELSAPVQDRDLA